MTLVLLTKRRDALPVGLLASACVQDVPQQLGLQVVVQPNAIGPFVFWTGAFVQTGKNIKSGAFSITMLQGLSDEEVQQISQLSQEIVKQMLEVQGFISWTGVKVGHRMMTVTAWETPEDVIPQKPSVLDCGRCEARSAPVGMFGIEA
jgi:hypothetical protein